jgi:hypothetical protein
MLSTIVACFVVLVLMTLASSGEALNCYQCSSADDPNCLDPFLPASRTAYLKPCPDFLMSADNISFPMNYTRCRKILQNVDVDTRTIRTCATAGSGVSRCQVRIGTASVKITYCECTGQDGCNGAQSLMASLGLVAGFSLAVSLLAALTWKSH